MNIYHILNGDALKEQFPSSIEGELIIMRECLVSGDVKADSLDEFYQVRAEFIGKAFEDGNSEHYFSKTVPELKKIRSLDGPSEVYLWFEKDLFCQVNLWCVSWLLLQTPKNITAKLVLPTASISYGFGGMNQDELSQAYREAQELSTEDLVLFSKLWGAYRNQDDAQMLELAQSAEKKFPFLKPTVLAELDRRGTWSKLHEKIAQIIKSVEPDNFGQAFRKFWEQEGIYGFGDLQFKMLYDEVKKHPKF